MHKTTLGLLALLLLMASSWARAALITYDFGVTALDGPLNGTSATGSFSFDDSIIPAGGGLVESAGLLADLEFTWNSIAYDESTANTGNLGFDSTGSLTQALFGNNCISGTCYVTSGTEQWAVFFRTDPLDPIFAYATASSESVYFGISEVSLQTIPEPTSLALLGIGLAGLGFARSRKAGKV